ncbi:site-specific integrase [Halolactibacillus miurensis]|uniref:Site-specific integrase n=2 Tax=Halolactibacillus miurensis TaxID=306541 RepID=A0A1I6S264_9BACI|nr:site-specific integrase [Halolactibacillus miurensis]GEM04961.1 site-specific integrase [Halolactibacillus miurensis]SFS71051.1 Site-specific recombinase XerD [Halolactibacillus miurensis]
MAYIRKRGKTWSYTVDTGIDPVNGRRRQKTTSGFKTKKEAELAAAKVESEVVDSSYVEVTKETFDKIAQEYFEVVAKNKMRESTYENRLSSYNNRIKDRLGKMKIKDIKPIHVQNFYNGLIEEQLTTSFVRTLHNLISSIFKYAHRYDYIKVNIMDKVDAPIPKAKEMHTWTLEEVNTFLELAKDYDTYIIYYLAIYTGMRRGEILGLRWKDIDFDNNKIHVTQNLVLVNNEMKIQEPKTKGSKRQIALTSAEMLELKKHRIKKAFETDLVVSTSIGTPYHPRNLLRNFNTLLDKCNVTKIRFHDLRHTHATLMLKLGENPKVVSERLGHSKVSITLDTYSHVMPDMQSASAEKFSNYLRGQNVVNGDKTKATKK